MNELSAMKAKCVGKQATLCVAAGNICVIPISFGNTPSADIAQIEKKENVVACFCSRNSLSACAIGW